MIELTGSNLTIVVIVAAIGLAALGVAAILVRQVLAADEGTDRMKEIAGAVQEGASAYLTRQFKTLSVFAVVVFFVLFLLPAETTSERIGRSIFFVVGAVFSGVTGYTGMWLAVRGNVRVAAAARDGSEQKAMKIAFRTGGVAGMFTVGLGLFGAALVVLVYQGEAPKVLEGFGFGAALLAMFMRVGGGIFTKAADVGADLVGKVEKGIPEDDPRNAATIADNVGDNVGDCAGMAADLFESYAVTLVAALILGKAAFGEIGLVYPLVVPAIGVITAVIGIFAVSPRATDRSGMSAINRGFFISAVISAVLVAAATFWLLPAKMVDFKGVVIEDLGLGVAIDTFNPRVFAIGAVLIGIILAAVIQQLTAYFTETNRRPVDDVAKSSLTGPGDGHPRRHLDRPGVRRVLGAAHRCGRVRRVPARRRLGRPVAVRHRARRHRPAHHGRRHRVHGHVRPGLGQRAGHRRDVRRRARRGRCGAHPPRRRRQLDEGHHQGHRDRDGRARRDRAVRRLPRRDHRGDGVCGRHRHASRTSRSRCSTSASSTWRTRRTSSA